MLTVPFTCAQEVSQNLPDKIQSILPLIYSADFFCEFLAKLIELKFFLD